MERKYSFNQAAELYDEVRPSYPQEVIDWIISKTEITKDNELLEIAPGTGQATIRFAEKGFKIHAVELGDNLAKLLLKNCIDYPVTVDVSPFEDWESEDKRSYKMMYCATAFHWLDPDIKYQKCASHLTDDGYLVILWNKAVGTDNPIINKAYEELYKLYPGRVFSTKASNIEAIQNQKKQSKIEIEKTGNFKLIDYHEHLWSLHQSKENTIKGFYTQSSYLSLEKDMKETLTNKLETLFEKLEPILDSDFLTTVFICKKVKE